MLVRLHNVVIAVPASTALVITSGPVLLARDLGFVCVKLEVLSPFFWMDDSL